MNSLDKRISVKGVHRITHRGYFLRSYPFTRVDENINLFDFYTRKSFYEDLKLVFINSDSPKCIKSFLEKIKLMISKIFNMIRNCFNINNSDLKNSKKFTVSKCYFNGKTKSNQYPISGNPIIIPAKSTSGYLKLNSI